MVHKEVTPTQLACKYLNINPARWFKFLVPLDTIAQNPIISWMKGNFKFQFKFKFR